jgi:hypothetical protein
MPGIPRLNGFLITLPERELRSPFALKAFHGEVVPGPYSGCARSFQFLPFLGA